MNSYMNNEFGYLDIKPFPEIKKEEQKIAIINEKENKLELKVMDVEKFNTFEFYGKEFGKLVKTKTFYGINSVYQPLTLYHCSVNSSSYKSIPYSMVTSDMYVIGNVAQSPIIHFTDKTKIKKIKYYNDNIKYIFSNKSMMIKRQENKMNISAKKEKEIIVSRAYYKDVKIIVKLINSYSHFGNVYNINIKPFSYFEIFFSKSVGLDTVLKISNRIDSIIHMFLFTLGRSGELTLYDTKNNSYSFINLHNNDKELKNSNFCLDKNNGYSNFDKLFNLFINIDDYNSNAFFPFINYDREISSIEIQFLEYYRVLEFTDMEERKRHGKERKKYFLLDMLKKYPIMKNKYFGNQSENDIEKEIRSLRNYYSHNGYYLKELPVPTFSPKYYKKMDKQWLYDVRNFMKVLAYLEIYNFADIAANENDLLIHLKF